MDKAAIETWAEEFVADLEVGGEQVPLSRIVAAHLATLKALRTAGLTWVGIAAILTRAGGRRAGGLPLSADRLRAEVSRASRRPAPVRGIEPTPAPATRSPKRQAAPTSTRSQRFNQASAASAAPPAPVHPNPRPPAGDKDLSAHEIAAALARINRS